MKAVKLVRTLSITLATFGLLVPNVGVAIGAEKQTTTRNAPAARIIDVSLSEGGVLQGQVVSGNGAAQANTPVSIIQGKESVATTKTNKNGEFSVDGLKGGVYVVSTDGASGVVRAWSPNTAPPSAVKGVLLVPGQTEVRGQLTNVVNRWGTGALIMGAIAAGIIAVSVDHSTGS